MNKVFSTKTRSLATALTFGSLVVGAEAVLTFDIVQDTINNEISVSYSGSIDLDATVGFSGFPASPSGASFSTQDPNEAGINPALVGIRVDFAVFDPNLSYNSHQIDILAEPDAFVLSPRAFNLNEGAMIDPGSDSVRINLRSDAGSPIVLPTTYQSGDLIEGGFTTTLDSEIFTPGSYDYLFGVLDLQDELTTDTITFNISTVPEPSSAMLISVFAMGSLLTRRRKG